MSVKKIWLYDNQQSFGNGAEVNRETDSSAPNTPDKIRWQDEKLWPAFYRQTIVGHGIEPTFVDPRNLSRLHGGGRVGPTSLTKKNDEGILVPVPYADGRKVHEIDHIFAWHDGSTRIGRHFEKFNLFIDVERFINDYGDVYDLPMVHFNALLRGEDRGAILAPRDIIEEKFVTAIRDLYGLYMPFEIEEFEAHGLGVGIERWAVPWSVSGATSAIMLQMKPVVSYDEMPFRVPGGALAEYRSAFSNAWDEKIGPEARSVYGEGTRARGQNAVPPPPDFQILPPPARGGHTYVTTLEHTDPRIPEIDLHPQNFFNLEPPELRYFINAAAAQGPDPDLVFFDYIAKVFLFRVSTEDNWIRGVMRVWAYEHAQGIEGFTDGYREFDIGFETDSHRPLGGNDFLVEEYANITIEPEDLLDLAEQFQFQRPDGRLPGLPPRPGTLFGVAISEFIPKDILITRRQFDDKFLDGFNKTYVDHFTSIDQALPESLVADAEPALLPPNPTVAIESAYNFELDDYERALHEVVVPNNGVRTIPNMYLLEDYTTTELDGDLPRRAQRQDHWRRLRDFVNIGGLIREPTRREREYFCAWTNEIVKVLPTDESRNDRDVGGYVQDFLDPSKAMRNIFIPPESKNFLNSVKPDRNNYPMYNTIRFSAGNQAMLWARRFRSRYLDKFFARARNEGVKAQFNTFSVENFGRNFGKLFSTNTGLSPQEFVVMDVLQYVHTFLAPGGPLSPSGLFLAAFLQKQLDTPLMIVGDTDSDHMLNEEFDIEQPELLHEAPWLSRYIRRLAKNNLRSYEQMLAGQEAPSQTIFYRIEKRLRDEVVQSIFVPNVDDFFDNPGLFEYVDTQIVNTELRFGTELDTHYYDIYAVRMILGNEYRRNITTGPLDLVEGWNYGNSNLETLNDPDLPNLDDLDIEAFWDDDNRAKIRIGVLVENTPSVKLVEVPIFKSRGVHTIDKPPLPPNVEFYSYEGVDNEVGIRMSMLAGTDVRMSPIPFNSREAELFRAILDEQRRNGITGNKVVFGNDDTPLLYEVRRLDSAPRSYEDFQDQPRHYTAHLGTAPLQSDAHFFIDSVTPNKKYYYIFRTLDTHELVSNPSSIYEVELVENAGAVYLLSEVYQLPEEKPNFVKDLQQYLKIKPSIIQSSLNERASGLVDEDGQLSGTAFDKNITLGPDANSVWNKKLKFRITSKKTGRKIDINLDFKTKQDTARGDAADDVLGCSAAPDPPPAVPPRPLPGDVDLVTGEVIQVPTPPVASPGLLIGAPPKQNLPSNGGKDS